MPDENSRAQTAETSTQQPGSAQEVTTAKTTEGGKVEASSQQNGGAPKGLLKEVFRLREAKRSQADELASLRAELDAFKAKGAGTSVGHKIADPLEDPDAYRAQLRAEAEKAMDERFQANLAEQHRTVSAYQAEQLIRSRSHVMDDPGAGDEIAAIVQSRYAHVAKIDPMVAAEQAYSFWCRSKGVDPDLSDTPNSLTPQRLPKPSSAGNAASSSVQELTPSEVRQRLAAAGGDKAKIAAVERDIAKAVKEGRYKGSAIKI
jgi:hypothetical protein